MNTDIKQEWVAALRSSKYHQGQDSLRTDDNRYCCLGVLCDIHAKATNGQWRASYSSYDYRGSTSYPPWTVREWADLTVDQENKLASLNDNGKNFHEIANYIEERL